MEPELEAGDDAEVAAAAAQRYGQQRLRVRGVVTDSGGVVPGVTVTLINDDNGQARESVSNETGAYNFAAVPPRIAALSAFERPGVDMT